MDMRKKNREITQPDDLLRVIERCDTCRVAFQTDSAPYIVPMNFGYCCKDGRLSLFFHCAAEGRKLSLLAQNNLVGFEMDCSHTLKTGALACDYSMNYESVIGSGRLYRVEKPNEKLDGLRHLMRHYGVKEPAFSPQVVEHTVVLRLETDDYCGKRLVK